MNTGVQLQDYQYSGLTQEGINTAETQGKDLANLVKAMEAGEFLGSYTGPGQTNAGVLKVESLETNLKVLESTEKHIRFWNMIGKTPAYNTVEEYNQLVSYGASTGGFYNEGELPEEEDSEYARKNVNVKFSGVTGAVTHVAMLVRVNPGIGQLLQRETMNKMQWLMRRINLKLFSGTSYVVPQEFNGIYTQHLEAEDTYGSTLSDYFASENVVDLRGNILDEGTINSAFEFLENQFSTPDFLMAPTSVIKDTANSYSDRKRVIVGMSNSVSNATMGQQITSFQTQYGLVRAEYDIFAKKEEFIQNNGAASHPKAPAVPVPDGTTPIEAVSDPENTKFGDGAGQYFYAVRAVNRYGYSAAVQLGTALQQVAATESVDLKFAAGTGPYAPTGYIIYRSEKDPVTNYANTKLYPILKIPASGNVSKWGSLAVGVDGGAADTVRDRNRILPNTQESFLMENSEQVFGYKQLAPIMRMPLAVLGPQQRFMVLQYGSPVLYAPGKKVRFINIGKTVA